MAVSRLLRDPKIAPQATEYGQQIVDQLRSRFIRAELGSDSDTVSKKIREGTTQKIPNLVVVGEREAQNSTVTLRRYGIDKQETLSVDALENALIDAIARRSLELQLS